MTKIILGALIAYLSINGHNIFSAILFVEGIILINWGVATFRGVRRI